MFEPDIIASTYANTFRKKGPSARRLTVDNTVCGDG
jgi:hypothetical protein